MSEENKAIAARGFEVYSTGNYDILDEVMSPTTSATTRLCPSRCEAPRQ